MVGNVNVNLQNIESGFLSYRAVRGGGYGGAPEGSVGSALTYEDGEVIIDILPDIEEEIWRPPVEREMFLLPDPFMARMTSSPGFYTVKGTYKEVSSLKGLLVDAYF